MAGPAAALGGLGGKLAESWVTRLVTPAAAFWLGGLGAWIWRYGSGALEVALGGLTDIRFAFAAAAVALLLGTSSGIVQRVTLPTLRLLEGYWPGWLGSLRNWGVERQARRVAAAQVSFGVLAAKAPRTRSAAEEAALVAADVRLARTPAQGRDLMPTDLGNVLRAMERRPRDKYGLDAVVCWPRLWLLVPAATRAEIGDARARLDDAVQWVTWGLAFVAWTPLAWWAVPAGIGVAAAAYRWAVEAAGVYADLVESAYDLHRGALYAALRWPLPAHPAAEHDAGARLTEYLWRGSDDGAPLFTAGRAPE